MKNIIHSVHFIILILLFVNISFSQTNQNEDPYLWLEEINGDKAIEWVKGQNFISAEMIEESPLFDSLYKRFLASYNDQNKIAYPNLVGQYVYNLWKDENNQQGVWRRILIEDYLNKKSNWEIILDLDILSKKENKNWVYKGVEWLKPQNERCLLYLSDGGSDKNYMREFNVKTKDFESDGFNHTESKDGASWLDEKTILIYRDFGKGSITKSGFSRTVRKWERGTDIEKAETIFEIDSTNMKASSAVFNNGESIHAFLINDNISTLEYYYLKNTELVKLSFPADALLYGVFKNEMLLLLRSDWKLDNDIYKTGSFISLNINDNIKGKLSVRPIYLPNDRSSFFDVAVSKDFITLNIMEDVQNRLLKYTFQKNMWIAENIDVPKLGSIRLIASDMQSNNMFFTYNNLITSTTLYALNLNKTQAIKTLKKAFNANNLEVHQYFASSKDGTGIPYFIVHQKNIKLNGNNPTIISAYGGFNRAIQPNYDEKVGLAWLERGGVYVIANIRGGGEYGPSWHKAAIKGNRQNAFDDLFAVTEDLISRNITSPKKLGLIGGSNGGLLAGVAYTQRPDLYNAIVCAVPILDMKRFSKLLVGASWISEYGDPDIPEEWQYLQKYSPYHNIKENVDYPEIFFITSTKDDRVHPGHARKMAKKLSDMGYSYYFHEKTEGGHGIGSTNKQIADNAARAFTFFNLKLFENETASGILKRTINAIDTIETIYYKQDMYRTNPRDINDTIFRFREMYFKRLKADSIVGVKGHWYMYTNNKTDATYEDIYDGTKLIRKNNRDSMARIYDLNKYPDFRKTHFWSHNTLFGMQYEFKHILNNPNDYYIDRLNDTIIDNKNCYQLLIVLEDKTTMPGFATELVENEGQIIRTVYFIEKDTFFPRQMKREFYSSENPNEKSFIYQKYYDIEFNLKIDDKVQFNTENNSITGFETIEMTPQ